MELEKLFLISLMQFILGEHDYMGKIEHFLEKTRLALNRDTDILFKYFFPPAMLIMTYLLYTNGRLILSILYGVCFIMNIVAIVAVEGRKKGYI